MSYSKSLEKNVCGFVEPSCLDSVQSAESLRMFSCLQQSWRPPKRILRRIRFIRNSVFPSQMGLSTWNQTIFRGMLHIQYTIMLFFRIVILKICLSDGLRLRLVSYSLLFGVSRKPFAQIAILRPFKLLQKDMLVDFGGFSCAHSDSSMLTCHVLRPSCHGAQLRLPHPDKICEGHRSQNLCDAL